MTSAIRFSLIASAMTLAAWAQQYDDGVVPTGPNYRYLTRKAGFWQSQKYLGEHGRGATPAEISGIDANLKRLQAVLMTTPTGANPVGFYFLPAPVWFSTRRDTPIEQGLSIFPLALAELRTNGVWKLDMSGETESVGYNINHLLELERTSTKILEEPAPRGDPHPIYSQPIRVGVLGGYPVYGDTLYIARPGRDLWRPITVERALKAAIPFYMKDRDSAERSLAERKQRAVNPDAAAYEQKELANFEKQFGYLRNTDPKDYEERKRQWMVPVYRDRTDRQKAAESPRRGDKSGDWYWNPIDAYAEAQRRLASLSPQEGAAPACFEKALNGEGRYNMSGDIRANAAGPSCQALVETNPDYYDRTLPRSAVQLITVTSITRCAAFRGNAMVSTSNHTYAGGCVVHAQMWKELDWQKLADLLVK